MGVDLKAIRAALAEQIAVGTDRQVHAYPYPTGAVHELPCVVVRSDDEYANYHVDLGVAADVGLVIDVMAPCRASIEDGLRILDELLSVAAGQPNSVIDAIETDKTLGGVVENCLVQIAGPQIGFGAPEDGRPIGVSSSIPVAVWVFRS